MLSLSFRPPAIAAALVLAAGITSAGSTVANTEYLGGGFVEIGDGCAEYGWSGTHQILVRIAPQGARGNSETETQIAMFMNTGTIALRVNINRGLRAVYAPTQAVYVWNGPYIPQSPTMEVVFHYYGSYPLDAGAEMDRFAIDFRNFNEHEGCEASLRASLARM